MSTSRLFLCCTAVLLLSHCQPAADTKQNNPTDTAETQPLTHSCDFVVGFDAWEPYQYIDVGAQVSGLDIELVTAVLTKMGCDIDFKAGTWVTLLGELKNGEIDILLGASKTAAREEFALFSQAYRTEEYTLYVLKDDATKLAFSSIASFIEAGKRIGVVEDYYYGPEVAMLRDGSATSDAFVPAIIGEVNIARLLDRDIDGFLEDSFVGASFIRRKALGEYIVAQGLTIHTGDTHMMFSKKSVAAPQVAQFDLALQAVKASQQYNDIVARYSQ